MSLKHQAARPLLPAIKKIAGLVSLKVVPKTTPHRDFPAFFAHVRRRGVEFEVLAGATGLLDQIDVVIIEASIHEFRPGAPEFHDSVIRMAELGYRGFEILERHYRSADGAPAQVDLAFVRNDSTLRAEKAFFTAAQAKRYLGASR